MGHSYLEEELNLPLSAVSVLEELLRRLRFLSTSELEDLDRFNDLFLTIKDKYHTKY